MKKFFLFKCRRGCRDVVSVFVEFVVGMALFCVSYEVFFSEFFFYLDLKEAIVLVGVFGFERVWIGLGVLK